MQGFEHIAEKSADDIYLSHLLRTKGHLKYKNTMMKLYKYGNPDAVTVLIQLVDDHDLAVIENEVAEIQKLTNADFYLLAIKVNNWNNDLSPWETPVVFGNEPFGSGATDTLTEVLQYTTDKSKTYLIGGYSLSALFALWAAYQTDVFKGVAAASPSIWFPQFTEYMEKHRIQSKYVYLSLGDKESKTRNQVMSTVGDRIQEAQSILNNQGVSSILEWNQGNHFKEPDLRTARAFAWLIKAIDT